MATARAQRLVNGWDTIRYELLNSRICDLELKIEGSPVEVYVRRLYRELEQKGLQFRPDVYPTDSWGCPDEVPVIGIPFYLTDKRLARLEEEQTGEIETGPQIMMLLRHEAGHAINYAYRLYRNPEWVEVFGSFSKPYRDTFRPNPFSRQFVRHLPHHQYGRTYAQKHPDEDFAETFAVWLTPRSGWRRRYRNWPALRKLQFVDRLMKSIREEPPKCTRGQLCTPASEMDILLAEHYGQRAERYRTAAQGYVDDKLREVFPPARGRTLVPAGELLRKHRDDLVSRVTRWSGLDEEEVRTLLLKLEDRADALGLCFRRGHLAAKIMDVTSLATALAMDFAYTGRLTG
ncbi:MAG TPA: putative zinc-binding metallopeptidase [Gemmataceae bacterium]|nr:putative zinc-binding metallopeptidase [Gemmataceae bacterium]